jgi:hypothetical protein
VPYLHRPLWLLAGLLSVAVPGVLWGQSSANETQIIRLICTLDYSLDGRDAKRTETSGEDFLTVRYGPDGRATIKKDELGAEFLGTVTDDEIVGDTEYDVSDTHIRQSIVVSRFTGSYRRTFIAGDAPGLIFYGDCRRVTEPKI